MKKSILFIVTIFTLSLSSIGQVNLPSGLIGFYPFSGNANDSSGNNYHGTVYGPTLTTDRFNNPNSAYLFDGINDSISLPSNNFLNYRYSYSVWVKPTNYESVAGYIISIGSIGGDQAIDLHSINGWGFVSYSTGNSPTLGYSTESLPNLNQWYHIAVTRDNVNYKIYLNGKLVHSAATNGSEAYYGPGYKYAVLGVRGSVNNQYFAGAIDDLRIYNRSLNESEISAIFNDCNKFHQQLNLGLVGSYLFNGNANDNSGNDNNGTVYGPSLTSDRFNNPNSAYFFDGVNDSITFPSNDFLLNNFTYSIWVKPTDLPFVAGSALSIGSIGGDQGISLHQTNGWSFNSYNQESSPSSYSIGDVPELNQWYHLVLTRSNSELKAYINGKIVYSENITGLSPSYGPGYKYSILGVRGSVNSQYFKGIIDDVKIYSRSLSDCEVLSLYNEQTDFILPVIEKVSIENKFEVFPNPSSGNVIIKTKLIDNNNADYTFEVLDLSGKVFNTRSFNQETQINTENLISGMYIYRVVSNGELIQTGKLVIK